MFNGCHPLGGIVLVGQPLAKREKRVTCLAKREHALAPEHARTPPLHGPPRVLSVTRHLCQPGLRQLETSKSGRTAEKTHAQQCTLIKQNVPFWAQAEIGREGRSSLTRVVIRGTAPTSTQYFHAPPSVVYIHRTIT